ncbi:alanine racemase [bacterium AH-315-J21]|nr:alanine racemase [bacterium AH-315-J21]
MKTLKTSKASKAPLSWIELDSSALAQNIKFLRELGGANQSSVAPLICAPIKANAYGHGLKEITRLLKKNQVDYLAAHSIEDARAVRKAGWKGKLLSVGYIQHSDTEEALALSVEPTLYNIENLETWIVAAKRSKAKAQVHLKIETGANRQGIANKDLPNFIQALKANKHITLRGLSTHFANIEDTTDRSFAELQLKRYHRALKLLSKNNLRPQLCHTASSAAHLVAPQTRFDMIRPGISLYGYWPSRETILSFRHAHPELDQTELLKPVASLHSRIAQIKALKAGESVGYGLTFRAERSTKIAVVPIGYYDGLDRRLSNSGYALLHGKRAKIIGRVCMNNVMLDISAITSAKLEDQVTFLGQNGSETITADHWANWCRTINYDTLTNLAPHLKRIIR